MTRAERIEEAARDLLDLVSASGKNDHHCARCDAWHALAEALSAPAAPKAPERGA